MGNGLDKTPFIQGTHKMLRICHHLFHNFLFSPSQQKNSFNLLGLSPDRRCVCFENLKLLLEQWGKFLHSLRSIERCWSFEKFGSEITCCLRAPLMERTFDMKSQERLLHTTAEEFRENFQLHYS